MVQEKRTTHWGRNAPTIIFSVLSKYKHNHPQNSTKNFENQIYRENCKRKFRMVNIYNPNKKCSVKYRYGNTAEPFMLNRIAFLLFCLVHVTSEIYSIVLQKGCFMLNRVIALKNCVKKYLTTLKLCLFVYSTQYYDNTFF